MRISRISLLRAAATAPVCAIALLACDGSIRQTAEISRLGETRIQAPVELREIAGLNQEALILEVLVNDQSTTLARSDDDIWSGIVEVPANQSSSVAVRWGQNYGDTGYIALAEQRKSVFSGDAGTSISFDGGYDTDSFNADNDAFSNLEEIREGRSPVAFLDVTINTDGAFATGGLVFPFSSECGSQIPISVPVQSGMTDGPADFSAWWCATLVSEQIDEQGNVFPVDSIRFIVNVTDDILFDDDAGSRHDDDSIELYIDGNNSKRSFYDGVNDYQLRFTPSGIGLIESGTSLPVPDDLTAFFRYFTGGYQLTAYVPLASTGIVNAQAFGLNIEVNDDDDGGDRDAKYSWIGIEDRDIAWRNPTAFGTAQVP